jgi:hypothetical protein
MLGPNLVADIHYDNSDKNADIRLFQILAGG